MTTDIIATSPGGVRVERVITSGIFALDGGEWEVDNNVWIVGDDTSCYVIDAAHQAEPILAAVAGRDVLAVLCTHAHNDHITAAPAVREATGAPIALHPADQVLWELTYPGTEPDEQLADGEELVVADVALEVLHTPDTHPARSVCMPRPSAWSSRETPSSRAGRARPAAPLATRTRSWSRSGPPCSPSPPRPWS